ncbi:M42 family metallopeptidase [Halosegnis marinus]|uniref:M42 family metallopeptidase n=1 Tax=Halosegnis marinus TaxID=3034023 RepID=A0ABD5ZRL4_9EURY
MPYDFDLLRELTETSGVPGYEDRVRDVVRREFENEVDRVESDGMGNVVGTIEGSGDRSVVVAAHMDEIGFMVRHVTDDGYLRLDALGGWDARVLKAQRVTVHTENGDIDGLIGSPPPHTMDEKDLEGKDEVADVHVDLGLDGDEVEERVAVGDLVTTRQTTELLGEHVTGKALDNRVSVFALVEAARRIDDPEATVHLAATVQEEVGLRGAKALGVDIDADLAIGLDTTVANDVPGFEEADHVTALGDGAGIKLKDSSAIANPKVHRHFRALAEEHDIDYQMEVLPAGGTDTAGLQFAGGATPAGAISFPTRYLHTVTESVHAEDVAAAIDLLVAALEAETDGADYTL